MGSGPCFFCPNAFTFTGSTSSELCDNCRAQLSGFLVWLGRSPLPPTNEAARVPSHQ